MLGILAWGLGRPCDGVLKASVRQAQGNPLALTEEEVDLLLKLQVPETTG